MITTILNDQNHILENCIGSVINFFILTQVPFVYMERVGFMTGTAANHQGAIKEPRSFNQPLTAEILMMGPMQSGSKFTDRII